MAAKPKTKIQEPAESGTLTRKVKPLGIVQIRGYSVCQPGERLTMEQLGERTYNAMRRSNLGEMVEIITKEEAEEDDED